VGVGVAAENL